MDEELYDEASVGITPDLGKPMTIIDKEKPDKSPLPQKKPIIPPANGQSASMTVKERLAMLQAKNNEPPISKGFPLKQSAWNPKNTSEGSTNNNIKKPFLNKPPISSKPSTPAAALAAAITNKSPTVNLQDLQVRKRSLKFVNKRESQLSDDVAEEAADDSTIAVTKDGNKFKKLTFERKPGKPSKPPSLDAAALPIVQYTDIATGVEQRINAGRAKQESDSFKIQSMTEEDEFEEEGSRAPTLPATPHPVSTNIGKRGLPPPPPEPASTVVDPSIEEMYGDGEVDKSVAEDGQELYEEFDEVLPPPMPSRTHAAPPQPPTPSPEPTQKLSKADKEKEKKEKQKQEKLAKEKEKQRLKEAKEREAFLKKYKISEEEVVTSHYVEAINSASGSKTTLAVKAKEKLQLIRKTGCPDGKWIVRNPHTDQIGLVEASNMKDLEEVTTNGNSGVPGFTGDEEIYEELN